MTIQEIHRLIEQNVQRMSFFAYKDLESEEVDMRINAEIDNIVNGILDKYFFRRELKLGPETGFQQNQVTLDNLRFLHTVLIAAVGSGDLVLGDFNGYNYFVLPANYYHHIKTIATVTFKCFHDGVEVEETKEAGVRIAISQYDMENHPFHKTGIDSVLAEIVSGAFMMKYDDTFKVTKARFNYIKKPAIVKYGKDVNGDYDPTTSVQCNLDDSIHHMLVDMTSIKIMQLLEANQQKIVNLKQEQI